MAIHRRKEKWDGFVTRLEDLKKEAEEPEVEEKAAESSNTRKTPSA